MAEFHQQAHGTGTPFFKIIFSRSMTMFGFVPSLLVVLGLTGLTVSSGVEGEHQIVGKYSSFQCIGGSQVFNTPSMHQASIKVFPLNDPEFRTCLYKNVCMVNGDFSFYVRKNSSTPKDFTPEGFGGNVNHLAYLRGFTVPVHTVTGEIPTDYKYSPIDLTFLDANSWSFNYGHYINDNVLPTYYASRLFNLPFIGSQQLFETNCQKFSTLDQSFTNRLVTYNHSMGTYHQACLEKVDKMYDHFFDHRPLYLDQMKDQTLCFKRLMTGQGSSYGLKSIDLGRAVLLREFRDYALARIAKAAEKDPSLAMPKQENVILVGQRTVGSAGGDIIHDLCAMVTASLSRIERYSSSYRVKCITPSDLTFEREIQEAQRAKVVITVHGTISYLVYFSRDGTQQISLNDPKELKENQMLLYATHFNTLYLNWDRGSELTGLLEHSIDMSEEFHYGN